MSNCPLIRRPPSRRRPAVLSIFYRSRRAWNEHPLHQRIDTFVSSVLRDHLHRTFALKIETTLNSTNRDEGSKDFLFFIGRIPLVQSRIVRSTNQSKGIFASFIPIIQIDSRNVKRKKILYQITRIYRVCFDASNLERIYNLSWPNCGYLCFSGWKIACILDNTV